MIILICGFPRAGKTTYSQRYKDNYTVIHLDECGMNPYDGADARIKRTANDLVVEGVYNRKGRRIRMLSKYKGNGKRVCIWLDTPKDIRQQRMGRRVCDFPFEPPTLDEGWDEIIIIRGDDEQRISK